MPSALTSFTEIKRIFAIAADLVCRKREFPSKFYARYAFIAFPRIADITADVL
jgi:hypothetical protein